MSLTIKPKSDGLVFPVKVVPGSSRTRISSLLGDSLKVQVGAPPEKGKANKELTRYLAALFKVPKANVTVVAGASNPRKEVQVVGLTREKLLQHLKAYL